MIQTNYPVWNLPRDVRQKLRAAGIKATDLAAWGGATGYIAPDGVVEPRPYTYKAKPRWSKARKAHAAMCRKHGVADLADAIFNIEPISTPFLASVDTNNKVYWLGEDGFYSYDPGQPASADPARPFPDGFQRPTYLDETGKGASAARAEIDIMDALRSAVKENW